LAPSQKTEELEGILRTYRLVQEICEKLWKNYGKITSPLTSLLKKNVFV
jgi:hypothetical protein